MKQKTQQLETLLTGTPFTVERKNDRWVFSRLRHDYKFIPDHQMFQNFENALDWAQGIKKLYQESDDNNTLTVLNDFFAGNYEHNLYAADAPLDIILNGSKVSCESVWQDNENDYYLHVTDNDFEGDIKILSLSQDNIHRVIKCLKKIMADNTEEKPTETQPENIKVRIKFSADLIIEGKSLSEVKTKWQNIPLFSKEAQECNVDYCEVLLIEDAENYSDLYNDFDRA